MSTHTRYPRLWDDVAADRGCTPDKNGMINGGQYAAVGISIINGCPDCQATVAPYNSYQIEALNPYAYCRDCAGSVVELE